MDNKSENGEASLCPSRANDPAACSAEPTPIVLSECRERFEREAVRGECATGRYRCSYFTWGQGPPLLWIHGLCDEAGSFLLPIALLSRHFRCIAYDLPAGGNDGANLAGYQLADYVADIHALLDHLKVNTCYLLGSSFGSTITLAALQANPIRFPRGILQGGFAHRPLAWAEVLLARLSLHWPGTLAHLPLRKSILYHSHHPPFSLRSPDFWDFFMEQSGKPPIAAVARRSLTLHQVDLRNQLANIRQPVLLICGDSDPLVGKKCEAELLNGLAQAVRVEFTHCGHLPQFTHPELLAEVIVRFLTPLTCAAEEPCTQ